MVRDLQSSFDKRHQLENVTEFKQFVANELKNLKQRHQSLTSHIGACESIMARKSKSNFEEQLRCEHSMVVNADYKQCFSFIEDVACQQMPENLCLSLACLLSVSQNGLPAKDYQNLRRQFVQAYGHKHLTTFFNLKKMNILYEKPVFSSSATSSSFQNVCKKLNLHPEEEVDLKKPQHCSYVFNGAYTPALCQIVDKSLKFGFNKEELSRVFACPTFAKHYESDSAGETVDIGKPLEYAGQHLGGKKGPQTVLVYFLGGVTYAEMAALHCVEKIRQCRIIVAATHIINRDKLLKLISSNI